MYQGEGYRPYYEFSMGARTTPVVKALLIINVAVFVLHLLLYRMSGRAGTAMLEWLGLSPGLLFHRLRVWQLVTYMFLHSPSQLFHVLFNMLFLYWFGRDIERRFGSRRFLFFYLSAGAIAGLVYCAIHVASPVRMVIGASGAIMAVLVVYAIFYPNRMILFMFIFPMRIRTFVIMLICMDLFYLVEYTNNGVANLAHLGGAAYGYLFLRLRPAFERHLQRARDRRMHREIRHEIEDEGRLDALLDKVHREGLHKLTASEKRFLQRMSKRKGE